MISFLGALISLMFLVHITFFFAAWKKRNDLADVIWGPGFVFVILGAAWAKILFTDDSGIGYAEVGLMICISFWALRLFYYLGIRTWSKAKEDVRYLKMRQGWGASWFIHSYLRVFILQAVILMVIATPAWYRIHLPKKEMDIFFYVGLAIWIFGFLIEVISDNQLKNFKARDENKGALMNQGLWSWSRHPNYFGEVVLWWGIYIMSFQLDSWWLVFSPITISFFILKISGVPMMEKLIENKPGFEDYKKRTSLFVLWPPKK